MPMSLSLYEALNAIIEAWKPEFKSGGPTPSQVKAAVKILRKLAASPSMLAMLEELLAILDGGQVSDNASGDNRPVPLDRLRMVIKQARDQGDGGLIKRNRQAIAEEDRL